MSFDTVIEYVMLTILSLGILGLGYITYLTLHDLTADTFELRKDSWECVNSHDEIKTRIISAGRTLYSERYTTTVCDDWRRKP